MNRNRYNRIAHPAQAPNGKGTRTTKAAFKTKKKKTTTKNKKITKKQKQKKTNKTTQVKSQGVQLHCCWFSAIEVTAAHFTSIVVNMYV